MLLHFFNLTKSFPIIEIKESHASGAVSCRYPRLLVKRQQELTCIHITITQNWHGSQCEIINSKKITILKLRN